MMSPPSSARRFSPQQRRDEELGLLRSYHSILMSNGVSDYPFGPVLI